MLYINHNRPGYLPDSEPAEYDVTSWPDMCAAIRDYAESAGLIITVTDSRAVAAHVRTKGRSACIAACGAELFAWKESGQ